jgi:hypothetical protein
MEVYLAHGVLFKSMVPMSPKGLHVASFHGERQKDKRILKTERMGAKIILLLEANFHDN